ncbi:type II toxin-antitoxin system HicA family toxin [bacterium]|nr:type II toxin-antitoxin system HicA family toxin [bacterium]
MSRLHPVSPTKLLRALEKLGFKKIRSSGSHIVMKNKDGRWLTIPVHKGRDVSKGILKKILKDIGMHWEELEKLL